MKKLLALFLLCASTAWAQVPVPATTPFTRILLRAPDAATADLILGITNGTISFQTFVNNFYSTNILNVNTISNYQDISVTTNVNFSQNITVAGKTTVVGLTLCTNRWAGPTNSLNLGTNRLYYTTTTDMWISNFVKLANVADSATLFLSNAAAADHTLFIPPSVRSTDGARSWVVTNAQVGVITIEYGSGMTNASFRPLW